jgi:hypothetical protein
MPASNRLPSDSDWEKQKGPATGNSGDDVGPKPKPHPNKMAIDVGAQFEEVNFAAHQARFARPDGTARSGNAGSGQADLSAQKESRGIIPADASFPSTKGNSPKRGAGKPTQKSDERDLSTAGP